MLKVFKRYLLSCMQKDLKSKIVLVTGPRQCGKTVLSKSLYSSFDYLNYDEREHHKIILNKSWDRKKRYIIFDEIHKKKYWKQWLKGVFDTEGTPPGLVVTGSARLDVLKKTGDSLAGRFFHFRLHPFDIKEVKHLKLATVEDALKKLLEFGGFPEPFLKAKKDFYGRWKKTHNDIILRQDVFNFIDTKSISSIETLVQLLRDRVGSPLSYTSLSEDLHCSLKTVKNWMNVLENLYVVFKVTPWHKNIARSLTKAPKYYFYDTAQVRNVSGGSRLENLVACSLLKEVHFREDVKGEDWDIFYLRNKDKKEVDFLIVKNNQPHCMIEVKTTQDSVSSGLRFFAKQFSNILKIQLVQNIKKEKTFFNGIEIRNIAHWLAKMPF